MCVTDQDKMNEMTNEIGFAISESEVLGCEDIECIPPGRCMMMFAQNSYQPEPKCM